MDAVMFNVALREKAFLFGGKEAKGGIAIAFANGTEIETGYSMGEVRLKAWSADHKPILDIATHTFDEAALDRATAFIQEIARDGKVTLP